LAGHALHCPYPTLYVPIGHCEQVPSDAIPYPDTMQLLLNDVKVLNDAKEAADPTPSILWYVPAVEPAITVKVPSIKLKFSTTVRELTRAPLRLVMYILLKPLAEKDATVVTAYGATSAIFLIFEFTVSTNKTNCSSEDMETPYGLLNRADAPIGLSTSPTTPFAPAIRDETTGLVVKSSILTTSLLGSENMTNFPDPAKSRAPAPANPMLLPDPSEYTPE